LKAQASLETLLIICAMISIILLMLPVFFNLKQVSDKSFEKLHLKNVANQLLYFCEKSFFYDDLKFKINVLQNQTWESFEDKLILTSQNFEHEIDFACVVFEDLSKGDHYFQIKNQKIQKSY